MDWRRLRLWVEIVAFYGGVPVAMAVALPASAMFNVLLGFTALGLVLLHLTPGFHWDELLRGWGRIDWRFVAVFAAGTAVVATAVVLVMQPGAFLFLARQRPEMLAVILLLYPLVSALPQEVIFRPLFFRRYGEILPRGNTALMLNAAIFSLAHLLYWNWVVAVMTFVGGLAFAWAYEVRRSFATAVVLHAVGGGIIFAAGLGIFFYTGNIQRPF